MAVVTDLGTYDDALVSKLQNLDGLLLEANHDIKMCIRDSLQLATDHVMVRIPKTKKTGTEIENYNTADVIEKYGVTPKAVSYTHLLTLLAGF